MLIGLTGGIGSGKTTVGKMFRELGVPVYNSDEQAKELMESSKEVRNAIKSLLGKKAYKGKKLNKKFISNEVFSNKELLEKLNAIVHPAVRSHFEAWATDQKTAYVIQEAAILFENGAYLNYDIMILVTAPKTSRIERIKERDKLSEQEILARMNNQWDDKKKMNLSDYVISNTNLKKTRSEVKKIHAELTKLSTSSKF